MEHIIYIYLIINALISGIYYGDSIQDRQDKFVCFGGIFLAIPVIIASFAAWFFRLSWRWVDNRFMISHKFRIKGDYYIKNFKNQWYRGIMEYKKKLEAKEKLSRYERRGYRVILEVEKKVGHLYKKHPMHDEMSPEEKIVYRLNQGTPHGEFTFNGNDHSKVFWKHEDGSETAQDDMFSAYCEVADYLREAVPGVDIINYWADNDSTGFEFSFPKIYVVSQNN